MAVDLDRRASLLDPPVAHHHDPVRHAHRFFLVMRDVDEGEAEPPVDVLQLSLQLRGGSPGRARTAARRAASTFGIVGERPGQRDALRLAAGQLRHTAVAETGQPDEIQRGPYLLAGLLLAHPPQPGAERDVLRHRQVREEGRRWKTRLTGRLFAGRSVTSVAEDRDGPVIGYFQARR